MHLPPLKPDWRLPLMALLAAALSACGSGYESDVPLPVLDPSLEVSVPQNGRSGETVSFGLHIVNGQEPFSLSWSFGGGAVPNEVEAHSVQRDSAQEVELAEVTQETTFTYVAHLTSAYGASAHKTGSFTVLPPLAQNDPPQIISTSFNETRTAFAVQASDPDGDPLTVYVTAPQGVTVSPPSQPLDASGIAVFALTLPPGASESPGSLSVSVEDDHGHAALLEVMIPGGEPPPPPVLQDDALYAIPQAQTALAGEPVTIVVATGVPASPFQFLNGVRVTVESGAEFVEQSFNVGAVGGETYAVDGIWAAMDPSGGFLEPPTAVHPAPVDVGAGRVGFDFGLTPLSGSNLTESSGELFNFALRFAAAGTYTLGFEGNTGVARTYYGYADDGVSTTGWGDISNSHPGFANSITVTEP